MKAQASQISSVMDACLIEASGRIMQDRNYHATTSIAIIYRVEISHGSSVTWENCASLAKVLSIGGFSR